MYEDTEKFTLEEIAQRAVEDIKKKAAQAVKDGIEKDFEKFFKRNPHIEAISWTQGTPSFNDGEPCTFYVCEVSRIYTTKELTEEKEDADEDEDSEDYVEEYTDEWKKLFEAKSMDTMPDPCSYDEDLMLALFGDCMRVYAFRDGTFATEDESFD